MTLKRQKQIKNAFFLFLFSFILSVNGFAQDFSNVGTHFFVAFGNNNNNNSNNVELTLRMTATTETTVTLNFPQYPGGGRTISKTIKPGITDHTLTADQVKAVYSENMTYGTTPNDFLKKSVEVTTPQPITLVAISAAPHSVEATQVWPIEFLGTEYWTVGMSPYNPNPNPNNCNGFLIIATKDQTGVTMQGLYSRTTVTLNKGQVFFYYMPDANLNDMRGTCIVSNDPKKPIYVFESGTNVAILEDDYSQRVASNHTFEQLFPVNQWGTKFIMPTSRDYWDATGNGGFVRVFAMNNTNVEVIYEPSRTKKTYNIGIPARRYCDIKIDRLHQPDDSACYITSDKPVSVCSYNVPHSIDNQGQPPSAWLPPVRQRTHNVLVSPLDVNASNLYLETHHYAFIITPSEAWQSTTLSFDSLHEHPQLTQNLPGFQWVAHHIGGNGNEGNNTEGSGYSFGRYFLGLSGYFDGQYKKISKKVMIDNPKGVIVLAYGRGTYTSYYYAASSGNRDLTAGFTVTPEGGAPDNYIDAEGKVYCGINEFTFTAYSEEDLTPSKWIIDGDTIYEGSPLVRRLTDGYHTISMILNGTAFLSEKTYTTHFYVGKGSIVWRPDANTIGTDQEKQDWNNKFNWIPAVQPSNCLNVYIPGNSDYYPKLTETNDPTKNQCNDIYFMQGGEVGRHDLLTYNKAHIQYNFGLKQSTQKMRDSLNLVLKSDSTPKRLKYSAAVSKPLDRERWYMLSAPLKGVVSGDLSFGGFPLTFMKKFGPINKDNVNYPVGQWTTPYTSMIEPLDSTEGFAFYMYGSIGNDDGCVELGNYDTLNDSNYLPSSRSEKAYGIKGANGILELPFFADSTNLLAHRTQVYNSNTKRSTFYYIFDNNNKPTYNLLSGKEDIVQRLPGNENYRLYNKPDIEHSTAGLEEGDEFLVGNPYMSSIDMVEFFKYNSSVDASFRIWNGTRFVDHLVNTTSGEITTTTPNVTIPDNSRYIAPLQGFILKYKGPGKVLFNAKNISTVRPIGTASNLRSENAAKEENILRVKAENSFADSYIVIGYKKGASNQFSYGEDVDKLFSPYTDVPEIYSLAGERPVSINFINNNGELIVPLGIKTDKTGEIRLTFTGMNNYVKASKIELIDAKENKTVNITGKSSYTYTFNHTEKGIKNGRFSLRISHSSTALSNITDSDNLNVYSDSKGIYVVSSSSDPVQKVEVYDFQGNKVYENTSSAGYYPLPDNYGHLPLIVKVRTMNRMKTAKVVISD